MVEVEFLRSLPGLHGLSEAGVRELAARGVLCRYRPRQVIYRAGDVSAGVLVIVSGQVRVIRETLDRRHVVHTEGPGGTLAEVPLFGGGVLPATARAVGATSCVLFTREGILAAIARDPAVALYFLERLAQRVRGLVRRLDQWSFLSVRGRLARHILERGAAVEGRPLSLGMTQQELAEELGTVREVVVRQLQALRRLHVIRAAGPGHFVVLDRGALQRLSQE